MYDFYFEFKKLQTYKEEMSDEVHERLSWFLTNLFFHSSPYIHEGRIWIGKEKLRFYLGRTDNGYYNKDRLKFLLDNEIIKLAPKYLTFLLLDEPITRIQHPLKFKRVVNSAVHLWENHYNSLSNLTRKVIIPSKIGKVKYHLSISQLSDLLEQHYPQYLQKHSSEQATSKKKSVPLSLDSYVKDGQRIHDMMKLYLNAKDPKVMSYFISESTFGNRIYHPIVNLNRVVRRHKGALTIDGENVCECDLKCSQVEIFNWIMKRFTDGMDNDFSQWFESVGDPYVEIAKLFPNENIIDRNAGKTFMFRMMYGKVPPQQVKDKDAFPHQKFCNQWKVAGDTLTKVKLIDMDENPKTSKILWQKRYTNSAFIMTDVETTTFSDIWMDLHHKRIPFVTIHDGIMCKELDADNVKSMMEETLKTVLRPEIEIKIH